METKGLFLPNSDRSMRSPAAIVNRYGIRIFDSINNTGVPNCAEITPADSRITARLTTPITSILAKMTLRSEKRAACSISAIRQL